MAAATSPLSAALSVSSFYSTREREPDGAAEEHVAAAYRDARQLPAELREHVKIYLEEKMCE